MFAVPSLKPNMLRGVACALRRRRRAAEASWDQRTATMPKPIRARLRTACTATCGSSEQAWMTMSPPERAGSSSSPMKLRQLRQRRAAAAVSPGRTGSSNSDGAEADVSVSGRGAARAPRRCPAAAPPRPASTRRPAPPRRPAVIRSAAAVHSCEQARSSSGSVGDDVERDEVQPVLRRRDDAGLVLPRNGTTRVGGVRRRWPRREAAASGIGQPGGRPGERPRPAPVGEDRPPGRVDSCLGHRPGDLAHAAHQSASTPRSAA